ncbi:MAG TPA: AraC family transcriptional regulator [Cytophagales bacterium]|nr:AraC family transcriptional regulator [Cytophagales bacterium]
MRTTDPQSQVVPEYRLEGAVHFVLKRMETLEPDRPEDEPPHRHSYYTIIWVEEGTGTHTIDFAHYLVQPGSIYFLTPEQVHLLHLETPPRGWVVEFNADFLAAQGIPLMYLTELQLFGHCDLVTPWKVAEEEMDSWRSLLNRMEREQQQRASFWQDRIGSLLKGWLIDLYRYRQERVGEMEVPQGAAGRLVREFKGLVEHHYREWHKVANYADALAVTPGHLSETVKAETHLPAKHIIQDRLLLEARRMARFTEYSVKETAHALGFDDPSHFAKVFKKVVGHSYLDFRHES